MRNPFNKAITVTDNKTGRTSPGKDKIMNKDLQKVADAAAAIDTSAPKDREVFIRKISAAQATLKAAREAKELAKNERDFDQACDDVDRARDKVAFYTRMVSDIDHKARMDEAVYNGHVSAVETVMNEAAAEYRKAAVKAMEEIIAARDKYEATASEADRVLEALDAAARVLQAKYRYRVLEFVGRDPEYIEDSNEWRHHSVRYQNGKAQELAICDERENAPSEFNPVLSAAWRAADRAQKMSLENRHSL